MYLLSLRNVCLCILLVATLGTLSAQAAEQQNTWAQPIPIAESENCHQVTEFLYRSAQPTAEAMQAYERAGIKTIINLRGLHSDKDKIKNTTLTLIELPINTWSIDAKTDGYIIRALQAIRDAPKPVLVHCQHGSDRTGMVIAMYRIVEQGWTKEQALDEMQRGGFGFHTIWTNIIKYINQADVQSIRSALY